MAKIEIDGQPFDVENGKMIIEVADKAGIYIPRFCYHEKLSIAANCRMCLVEVENGRKPVPACATPIADGMKIFTKSEQALKSQKAVMEFLLINHPLDCPICDQGGECELQDLSMGFGYDDSGYHESKRAVDDDNLGSLIATEMTRCIQCTRCVRFGEEIAGQQELGALGRGESMQIGTYVQHSMQSEISGNIIDLCPVGALTSKPARFKARPWELSQYSGISPHDCLGSNIYFHVRRNELIRVIPSRNDDINETWLSDRDRFSYLALGQPSRAQLPVIKRNGQWEFVPWPEALNVVAQGLADVIKKHGPSACAALASPSSTLEEMYLLQKMMRSLGVNNLDHRLHQVDFRDAAQLPTVSLNSISYEQIEEQKHIVMIGTHLIREVPLALVRLRKAHQAGASLYMINAVNYDMHVPIQRATIISPQEWPLFLTSVLSVLCEEQKSALPLPIQRLLLGVTPCEEAKQLAAVLKQPNALLLTGALIEDHPEAALLRTLIYLLAEHSGSNVFHFTTGANASGARIAGMLPERGPAGKLLAEPGLDIQKALEKKLKSYFLLNVEPSFDIANPHLAHEAMLSAEFVVMLSPFYDESMKDYATVILPIAPYAETSGTYVNVDSVWQTFSGACPPIGESRPAWKILRVLANLLECPDCEYESSADILDEITIMHKMSLPVKYDPYFPDVLPVLNKELVRLGEWPLYHADSLVRRATVLHNSASSDTACIKINPSTAERLNLGDIATISQGDIEITLPLKRDERIAIDVVWVLNALPETADLGYSFAEIAIKRSIE